MRKWKSIALLIPAALLSACSLMFSPQKVSFDSLTRIGNAVAEKGTSEMRSASRGPLAEGEVIYLSGLAGTIEVLFQIRGSGGGEVQRNCLFNGHVTPPSAFPCAFSYGGESYLLFSTSDDFVLYKHDEEDKATVSFLRATIWDFSAVSSWIRSLLYQGNRGAWALCPDYCDARKTLYFTVCRWEENALKGDFIRVRVYESKLVDGVFQAPAEVKGAIDPHDPSHYIDGQRHTENDFPGRMGIGWIGRLHVTEDGTKAFYNCLNVSFTGSCAIMKPDDPYLFPTPNCNDFGTSGVTDLHDPRLIYAAVYQADIDAEGDFNNIRVLPPSVNQGGVNFVSDISPDGSRLYVSHMGIDDDFWAYGLGPDGLALELGQKAPCPVSR